MSMLSHILLYLYRNLLIMKKQYSFLFRFLLFMLLSPVLVLAQSAPKKVGIETSDNKFTPQDITINLGDTVEFKLKSGAGVHPTSSDDGLWTMFTLTAANPSKKLSAEFKTPGEYTYYCNIHGSANGYPNGMTGKITVLGTTGVSVAKSLSNSLNIYPNPVDDRINVEYYLKRDNIVNIKIIDVLGNEVLTLLSEKRDAGSQKEAIDLGNKIPGGLYFIKISIGSETMMKRISII